MLAKWEKSSLVFIALCLAWTAIEVVKFVRDPAPDRYTAADAARDKAEIMRAIDQLAEESNLEDVR